MMGKFLLVQVCAGILLLLAGRAGAAIPAGHASRAGGGRSREVADLALPKAIPTGRQFANSMLDPARCNYEYVEMYGAMIVRTELKLTCMTQR